MAVEKSYASLGLFLVIAIVVIVATGLLFVQRMRSRGVIEFVTYSQENVTGLDISSPVRYRGVAVGRVSNLQVEPGGRTDRDRLRAVHRSPDHRRRQCHQPPESGRGRRVAAATRSGGEQPRDRRAYSFSTCR